MSHKGFDVIQRRWRADIFPHSDWDVSMLRASMARAELEGDDMYSGAEDRRRSDSYYEKVS